MKAGATFFGGPLGGIASSLIGSAVDGRQQRNAQDRANAYNSPVNQRALAEAAGINPLVTIGKGTGLQNGNNFQPTFGQAFHNAVTQMRGDNIDQEAIDIERSKLELEKQKFQEYRTRTIRPKRAGLYGVEAGSHDVVTNGSGSFASVLSAGKKNSSVRPDIVNPDHSVLKVDQGVSPTQIVEDEYGDAAGDVHGLEHYFRDRGASELKRFTTSRFVPAYMKPVLPLNKRFNKPLYSLGDLVSPMTSYNPKNRSSRARSRRSYRPQISN